MNAVNATNTMTHDDDVTSASPIGGDSSEYVASEVYVTCTPLKGLETLGHLLGDGDAYPDRLEHTAVLVRHPGETGCMVYDFLPVDPQSPLTAAALGSGGTVDGRVGTFHHIILQSKHHVIDDSHVS
jgi:hypothetical protein